MSDEYDTTEKVERTDKGFRLTVESTRGTGTRDQDKVKAEARVETIDEVWNARGHLVDIVGETMEDRRAHHPDEYLGDDE